MNHYRAFIIGIFLLPALALSACGAKDESGDGGADPCEGIACSGYGDCIDVGGEARCLCMANYHSDGVECIFDLCLPVDCINGHCLDPAKSSQCVCDAGYGGIDCNDCAEGYARDGLDCVPAETLCGEGACGGRGGCVSDGGSYYCDCDDSYEGEHCESCADGFHLEGDECVQDSACNPNPCRRGACAERSGVAICTCSEGYAGRYCESCAPGYVADGLDCVQPEECDPEIHCSGHGSCTGDGFACDCNEGYSGGQCDSCSEGYHEDEGECLPDAGNPCAVNPCIAPNRTRCVPDGEDYSCSCDPNHVEIAGVCAADCDVGEAACAFAHSSFGMLVSGNGYGHALADLELRKLSRLVEHPYKTWGPTESGEAAQSRDILYDAYFGIRANGVGLWLNTLPIEYAGYYNQDGIMYLVQRSGDFRIETFAYAPWELSRPALLMLARVTNFGESGKDLSLYSLHNYHIGNTDGPSDIDPDSADERIVWSDGAYRETGPGGGLVHFPIGPVSHHGANGVPANNPWARLTANQDLMDDADTGLGDDRVCGFQKDFTLAPGESGWLGVATAFDRSGDLATLAHELESAYSGETPDTVLENAVVEWEAWRGEAPPALSAAERWTYRVSEAILRMGQSRESGKSKGQILAALPPGNWSISWVRDMSYALVALARSGHYDEARAGLAFMLEADSGEYRDEVGHPYRISVCRYYGKGREESDHDMSGPNIEFDGFGLFLWALGEYVRSSGDDSLARDYWTVIRDRIAGVLVSLIEDNGMISPDSSIWEVHWNGREKQFSYTSLAAARGLCDASLLAETLGHYDDAAAWEASVSTIVSGIRAHALDDGFLVQSLEEFTPGGAYYDSAVADAFNWMLFDPDGVVARETFARFDESLRVSHGLGYFRNDDGGEYDSKEWVFVDLRIASALRAAGRGLEADAILDWITAQAINNLGLIAELHNPVTADYEGAIPMVGFGAGAYILNLWGREAQPLAEAACNISWEQP